jgi:hypothetical protein
MLVLFITGFASERSGYVSGTKDTRNVGICMGLICRGKEAG